MRRAFMSAQQRYAAYAHFDKAMSSTGADFRGLAPLVLMSALRQAGTAVYEPVQRFRLKLPADLLGRVLPALARLRAVPGVPEIPWFRLRR